MMRLLIAGVIVIALSAFVAKQILTPQGASTSEDASTQVDQARQDVNDAMNQELQRAQELSQPGE